MTNRPSPSTLRRFDTYPWTILIALAGAARPTACPSGDPRRRPRRDARAAPPAAPAAEGDPAPAGGLLQPPQPVPGLGNRSPRMPAVNATTAPSALKPLLPAAASTEPLTAIDRFSTTVTHGPANRIAHDRQPEEAPCPTPAGSPQAPCSSFRWRRAPCPEHLPRRWRVPPTRPPAVYSRQDKQLVQLQSVSSRPARVYSLQEKSLLPSEPRSTAALSTARKAESFRSRSCALRHRRAVLTGVTPASALPAVLLSSWWASAERSRSRSGVPGAAAKQPRPAERTPTISRSSQIVHREARLDRVSRADSAVVQLVAQFGAVVQDGASGTASSDKLGVEENL